MKNFSSFDLGKAFDVTDVKFVFRLNIQKGSGHCSSDDINVNFRLESMLITHSVILIRYYSIPNKLELLGINIVLYDDINVYLSVSVYADYT